VTEKYDLLLRFLSEKGAGTWRDFKGAFDWIWGPTDGPAEKAWIAARDFAALGHIEIAWDQGARWCAAPPLITMLPRSGGRAFVTGARTGFLAAALERVAEERGLWIDRCGGQRGPQTLLLASASHLDTEGFASDVGAGYTYSVADQISALLPELGRYMDSFAVGEALPAGFEAERFDPTAQRWDATADTEQRGLYRTRTFHGQVFALLDAASRWRRPVREFGIYEVLRWERRNVLCFSERRGELLVPVGAPLPALHARAASLCSGRLPHFQPRKHKSPMLVYDNIPPVVAARIAESLSQELGEDDRA
jgi:NAD(P)-dependent dehydrogenase (short-subunit alcohol dehydrogenase family)